MGDLQKELQDINKQIKENTEKHQAMIKIANELAMDLLRLDGAKRLIEKLSLEEREKKEIKK